MTSPAPERRVVTNTTPLIALGLVGRCELLRQLYGEIVIPPAVHAEIAAEGAGAFGAVELKKASWIRVVNLTSPRDADLIADLDRGEAEVLALALQLTAEVVIIDERLARRHAIRLGLPLTGTLGVLLKAKQRGLLAAVRPLIDQMRAGGIWLADALVTEVLRQSDEQR